MLTRWYRSAARYAGGLNKFKPAGSKLASTGTIEGLKPRPSSGMTEQLTVGRSCDGSKAIVSLRIMHGSSMPGQTLPALPRPLHALLS